MPKKLLVRHSDAMSVQNNGNTAGRLSLLTGNKQGEARASTVPIAVPGPPVCEHDPYPRHDPGIRTVRCHLIQGPEWVRAFRRWSVRVECDLVHETGTVSAFLNLGNDPNGPKAGRLSKYRKLWELTKGRPPRKGEAMSQDAFRDQWYEVRIEDCTQDKDGKAHAAEGVYSKIVEFLACVTPNRES